MFVTTFGFWLLLGIVLLLSELFLPSLLAAFFGIGALVVGLLTLIGVIETLPAQLTVFAAVSLISLFALRRHFHHWMKGSETHRADKDLNSSGLVGTRVKVQTDFVQGRGEVVMSGAKWDAESEDPLQAGDSAWITSHRGILLTVSATKPTDT